MIDDHSPSRRAGNTLIGAQAQRQVQTFFDELKNGTRNYRTVSSLDAQIAQAYRGRCVLELLQNAHDALANASPDDPGRISFVLNTASEPVLLIANSGRPFLTKDFQGICQLAQSPKDPNENIGNKGLGFRSVLEVSTGPEIWSTTPSGSDTSFVFRFHPNVVDRVAEAAIELEHNGLNARSPFDADRPLVDWSSEQLNQYRERASEARSDGSWEATNFLSPYLVPLPIEERMPPDVKGLLSAGHATVVRLRLDGGKMGTIDDALQSVKDQLWKLDARSNAFLYHLESLVIDIDGERRTMERVIESETDLVNYPQTRQQRLQIRSSGPAPDDSTTRHFLLWTRIVGGDDDPEQAERIRDAVEHLPNRWPEVRQVSVAAAVEDAPAPDKGVFVIFLPTEVTTGSAAHVNAPFFGSLDRRQIDFNEPYNDLLLECVLDLCIDAAAELVAGPPRGWRARAVVDLLSSTATVGGQEWCLINKLRDRASARDNALENQALILCDDGWRLPADARMMPKLQDDNPIRADRWREYARFAVVSTELGGRLHSVEELLVDLDGSTDPTHQEWRKTINRIATQVDDRNIDVTWDAFLNSLISVLPATMRAEPPSDAPDPLADARFLPTHDGRLLSAAADSAKLFFPPVRGTDDAADFVGDIPSSLIDQIAFLHPDVQTQEGRQRRNTTVQKFLDGRFARSFRREDLLRNVIIPALPRLPTLFGGPEAERCSELLNWTLRLLGNDESDTLLPLIQRLPVACHGGWLAMSKAAFGPGWPHRLGDSVKSLADELPTEAAERLLTRALLPPDDPRWGVAVEDRSELLARAGVVDGLRLQLSPEISFSMSGYGSHDLPSKPPITTPQPAWDHWRNAVREQASPYYYSVFSYALSGVRLLPEIHHRARLSSSGRRILSQLVLASLAHWDAGWESAVIKKTSGNSWSTPVTSPLKYWLKTLLWLSDRSDVDQPLEFRWLVPESLLRGQRDRYSHLDPLSLDLARRLIAEPKLKDALVRLGLNVYPTEEDRTGPKLLDALATAWNANRVPAERFDVFLGQVRDAWAHFDPRDGLPARFLVRTGRRRFSARGSDELADVYLPDDRGRTRSLREREMPILEMHASHANSMAEPLAAKDIKRASLLEERFLVDGNLWSGVVDGISPLDATKYAAWLPITLLTVAGYGGTAPTGTATRSWRDAADTLRHAYVLECEEIAVELIDGRHVVASRKPQAQWLPGDVLAIRRDNLLYESLAPAAHAMLGRQDLLKDLRLVLGALGGEETPSSDQVEAAMERAEIDAQSVADVRDRWIGDTGRIIDRIRPVLMLLGIRDEGIDVAAIDMERLTLWLSANLRKWSVGDVLGAARRCRDECAMGEAVWHSLGDVAQLPAWNEALATLGEPYATVHNSRTGEQAKAHMEEAMPLLRSLARYVAVEAGHPDLFHRIEQVTRNFHPDADWSTQWWEVPFGAVLAALQTAYAAIPDIGRHLEVLQDAKTIDDLSTACRQRGITADPNPYETAALNRDRLKTMLVSVQDLHRSWMDFPGTERDPSRTSRTARYPRYR